MQGQSISISLDRLLAALEVVEKARTMDQGLKNEPPKIIFATHPTVLVPLDGDPKLLPVPKSSLMRVANTAFIMVYEPASKTYYLKGGDDWLSSANLQGPWQEVETLPAPLKALEDQVAKAKPAAGQAAPKQVTGQGDQRPAIVVSTVPAELLVTRASPSTPRLPARTSSTSAIPRIPSLWTWLPRTTTPCFPAAGSRPGPWPPGPGAIWRRTSCRRISPRSRRIR